MNIDMNGAESLVRSLLKAGVDTCFANPGTSEMHFVAALDTIPGMRCVLGLFEGVVTGAADGYGRMKDFPAATLLHLGPGLANGLANLHNARRAGTPIVNIVGEHASWHRTSDAPLTSDINALARPMSDWVRTTQSSAKLGQDGADAVSASLAGKVATLIVPADYAWEGGGILGGLPSAPSLQLPSDGTLGAAASALLGPGKTMLLLGGKALRQAGLLHAARIAAHSGATLASPTSNARIERGAGRVNIDRIPYPVPQAIAFLKDVTNLILVGCEAPVAFFGYPDGPSSLVPDGCKVINLAGEGHDLDASLEMLAERVGAQNAAPVQVTRADVKRSAEGTWGADAVLRVLADLIPDQAILVDESLTSGRTLFEHTKNAAPHDHLSLTGGAIGLGLPMATGASIACPTRKVISLEGDGSGMYTAQALWTQARERLDVLTIIFANRGYQILRDEMHNMGIKDPGERANRMLTASEPELNWVGLAQSMGVDAASANCTKRLSQLIKDALNRTGPYLIEVRL